MNSRDTMRTAQTLYENGFITYAYRLRICRSRPFPRRSLAASRYGKGLGAGKAQTL